MRSSEESFDHAEAVAISVASSLSSLVSSVNCVACKGEPGIDGNRYMTVRLSIDAERSGASNECPCVNDAIPPPVRSAPISRFADSERGKIRVR